MFAILVLLVALHNCTPTLGLHNNNNNNNVVPYSSSTSSSLFSRRKMIEGIAGFSIILPSCCACRQVDAVSPPLPIGTSYERVQGIGGGYDMLTDKPINDVDILFPPSLNGTWVCERKVISVEGDINQAQGAWKLLGGTIPNTSGGGGGGDFQKVVEKYYVRFVDLRRDTDGIIGLDGKKYYGDIFDRGYEMEERTSSGSSSGSGKSTLVQWDPRAPNTLKYERSSAAAVTDGGSSSSNNNISPATELKVVQRKVEPQNNKGSLVGSNELIRVTTKITNALFGSSFDVTYATRVQRRWRRSTSEEGDRVVEGLEIVKTYRVLDGIAGIEFPTSTVKSTIRLTRTYPTRPPTT